MTTRRWIISHRRCWITVYVSCHNAQLNIIVVIMPCICIVMRSLFFNCPAVICSPSMLVIFYGETPLVNCGPRSILLHWLNNHKLQTVPFSFSASKHHFPHHTFNPLFSASRWDWQPHSFVGTKYFDCVVCRFQVNSPDSLQQLFFWRRWQPSEVLLLLLVR